jgi:AGCS family alanine or glycine:cation symporter
MPPLSSGLIVSTLVGFIIIGGIKRIGSITQMLIPLLSILYILGALIIIILNIENIPSAFSQIFKGAFGISAVGGGISGAVLKNAINSGLRRGIFSNEAGLGSSALLHSAAESSDPEVQGMWGIFEVFIDTIVCCTLTALVILTTSSTTSGLDGAALVIKAFSSNFGSYGGLFITIAIILFAFATLIGWSYCGECSIRYISGEDATKYYRTLFIFIALIGALAKLDIAWAISDIFNGLMAVPNLIGILLLSSKLKVPNFSIRHKSSDNNT